MELMEDVQGENPPGPPEPVGFEAETVIPPSTSCDSSSTAVELNDSLQPLKGAKSPTWHYLGFHLGPDENPELNRKVYYRKYNMQLSYAVGTLQIFATTWKSGTQTR